MIKNISLTLLSIILFFLLTEIFLRLLYPINTQDWYAEKISPNNNYYALKKNYRHRIDRWNHKYFANYTFGEFRNRLTRKIDEDKEKVLILGDSFTFGLYIKDNYTYVDKLQQKYNKFYLVNSSTPGWGLEDYFLFSEQFCNIINPTKIIIILNDGDIGRIRKKAIISSTKSLKEKYYIYKLLVENFMVISLLRNRVYKLLINKNQITEKNFYDTGLKFDPITSNQIIEDGKKLFLKLKKVSLTCNAELNIIKLGWSRKNSEEVIYYPHELFFKKYKDFFSKNQINFYDNTPYLANIHKNKEEFIIKNEGHPNENGTQMIFQSLIVHFDKILK